MTVLSPNDNIGAQKYPFLDGMNWSITTTPIGDKDAVKAARANTKGISLRWVKADKISDLRLGKFPNYRDALKMLGLDLSLKKGGFVLSKRISRIMRPYTYFGFFTDKTVSIRYDAGMDKKLWDGAGLIKRSFLNALTRALPNKKRRELLSSGRVQLTVLSSRGQDKGHALVVEDLDSDLVLPLDTKAEVRLVDGRIFVGVQPVHSRESMWLDVQSMINIRPFLSTELLIGWLKRMGDQFLTDIQSGHTDVILADVTRMRSSVLDIETWPVAEYLASGGQSMWFASVVKQLSGQFTKKVKARSLTKLRTPVPGGYYYVFADIVGNREVPAGQIELDKAHATAWVSRDDWAKVAEVLGGADQDDALWVLPFRDWDGELKVMAWRSPNQLGEYMLFSPKEVMDWAEWPELDSRLLPTRIDQRTTTYLGLAGKAKHADQPYSIKAMDSTIVTSSRQFFVLGMTVNLQMALKALEGTLPDELPELLSVVVDNQVKDGGDLSAVHVWNRQYARAYFMAHMKVPAVLQHRILGFLREDQREWIEPTTDHWLDDLIARVQTYLHEFQAQRDALMKQCMPPLAVFRYGKAYTKPGGLLKTVYAHEVEKIDGIPRPEDFERARAATEQAMTRFPTTDWTHILAGAAVRTYVFGDDKGSTSDAVMWQLGKQFEVRLESGKIKKKRKPGIAHLTLKMLRECGVIGELVETTQGIVNYLPEPAEVAVPVRINGPWFSYAQVILKQQGREVPMEMGKVSKGDRAYFKGLVETWASSGKFDHQVIYMRTEDWNGQPRVAAYRNETRLGFVHEAHTQRVGDTLTPALTFVEDGNLLICGS